MFPLGVPSDSSRYVRSSASIGSFARAPAAQTATYSLPPIVESSGYNQQATANAAAAASAQSNNNNNNNNNSSNSTFGSYSNTTASQPLSVPSSSFTSSTSASNSYSRPSVNNNNNNNNNNNGGSISSGGPVRFHRSRSSFLPNKWARGPSDGTFASLYLSYTTGGPDRHWGTGPDLSFDRKRPEEVWEEEQKKKNGQTQTKKKKAKSNKKKSKPLTQEEIAHRLLARARGQLLAHLSSPACRLFSEADHVVAVSDDDLDELLRSGGGDATKVIYYLRAFDDENRKFDSFDELMHGVIDARNAAGDYGAGAESKQAGDAQYDESGSVDYTAGSNATQPTAQKRAEAQLDQDRKKREEEIKRKETIRKQAAHAAKRAAEKRAAEKEKEKQQSESKQQQPEKEKSSKRSSATSTSTKKVKSNTQKNSTVSPTNNSSATNNKASNDDYATDEFEKENDSYGDDFEPVPPPNINNSNNTKPDEEYEADFS